MIPNKRQYRVTKGEIDRLQQAIDKLQSRFLKEDASRTNILPSQLAGMQNSFQTQIDRMQMEIQEYADRQVIT